MKTNTIHSIRLIHGGDDHQRYKSLSKTYTALQTIKKQARINGELLVHISPGDSNQGESDTQWNLDTAVRQTLGPLLGTIGNHETYLPLNVFINTLIKLNSNDNPIPPYLVSNLTSEAKRLYEILIEKGLLFTEPFIHEEQGVKIGFIGIGPELSNPILQHHGFTTSEQETYNTIETQLEKLKSVGVDLVVIISHRGGNWDRQLAQQSFSKNIDLILGGHDHIPCSGLIEGKTLFTHKDGSQTVVANAGAFGMHLTELYLSRNAMDKFTVIEHNLISTDKYPENATLLDLVKKHKGESYFTPYAKFSSLSPRDDSESILAAVAKAVKSQQCTQIGIVRKKAIRLDNENALKEISEYQLESILPYDEEVIVSQFTGEQLISLINENKQFAIKHPELGQGLIFSGLREREGILEVETEPNLWQNIKPKKKYTIAHGSYRNQDFSSLDAGIKLRSTGKTFRHFINATLSG